MEPDRERIVGAEQLPDDPLEMPPPYWRSSGVVFCMLDALESLPVLLEELVPVLERTERQLEPHFEKYGDSESDEAIEAFSEITFDLSELESTIGSRTMTASLMSAIETEDRINMFCVYNLPKESAQSIENLPSPDKLLVATGMVGQQLSKSDSVFAAIKDLSKWRNAFVHGHCVDRPTQSLRHNHLIPPEQYPGVVSHLQEMRKLVQSYIRVCEHLSSVSKNEYTAGSFHEVERAKELLGEVARYRFSGDEHVYSITVSEPDR